MLPRGDANEAYVLDPGVPWAMNDVMDEGPGVPLDGVYDHPDI